MHFLTIENAKTIKGQKKGYLTGILYLAPANEARAAGYTTPNACPFASAGCKSACLFTAGRGAFSNVRAARIRKTIELMAGKKWNEIPHPGALEKLRADIAALEKKAKRLKLKPAVRLNGTSDFPVDTWGLMEHFPRVQFYDYTKNSGRMILFLAGKLPKNYFLTFSRSEHNQSTALEILDKGGQIAAVFSELPKKWFGARVKNGDESDLTFTRGAGILGLKAKGKARKDQSGFVVTV